MILDIRDQFPENSAYRCVARLLKSIYDLHPVTINCHSPSRLQLISSVATLLFFHDYNLTTRDQHTFKELLRSLSVSCIGSNICVDATVLVAIKIPGEQCIALKPHHLRIYRSSATMQYGGPRQYGGLWANEQAIPDWLKYSALRIVKLLSLEHRRKSKVALLYKCSKPKLKKIYTTISIKISEYIPRSYKRYFELNEIEITNLIFIDSVLNLLCTYAKDSEDYFIPNSNSINNLLDTLHVKLITDENKIGALTIIDSGINDTKIKRKLYITRSKIFKLGNKHSSVFELESTVRFLYKLILLHARRYNLFKK